MKSSLKSVCITVVMLLVSTHAMSVVEYDQDIVPDIIFGSGNSNGFFTTDRNNGVEVGLRAKIPYNGLTNSNGDGTYSYTLAETDYDNDPGTPNRWNYDFAINVNYDNSSGMHLDDFTYELGIDADPSLAVDYYAADIVLTPIFGVLAPDHAIGDNSTANGAGSTYFWFSDYETALAGNNVVQNSSYYSLAADNVPGFTYDPDIPGTYGIYLLVRDGTNQVVARTDIQVLIGGAPPAFVPDAPVAPLDLVASSDSGASDTDDTTNETLPDFMVTCSDVSHVVNIYSDLPVTDTLVGIHNCSSVGSEQASVTVPLVDGIHNLSYTETNVVGESAHSATLAVTIDTVAPNAPLINVIADNVTQLSGTAEAMSALTVNGVICTNAPIYADNMGNWSCDYVAPLGAGSVVNANATDIAGNISLPSLDSEVQHVNLAPSFNVVCDLDATDVTGPSQNTIFYPGYAYGMDVGTGETQNYTMSINVAPANDPDGVIDTATINASGDLIVVVDTATSSVATVDITMQDDGGTALGGIDTAVISFNVHNYADLEMDPNYAHLPPGDIIYKNTMDVCRY